MQAAFSGIPGVNIVAGYTGGKNPKPTYENYAKDGHIEAIQITFDLKKTTYEKLLDIFWRQVDPTDSGGQFADRGPQYRSVIFYHSEDQKNMLKIQSMR